ncbi:MAG: COX15/CtaA family protein [Pirellulales bacterium]
MTHPSPQLAGTWSHRLAVVLAGLTFPLIWVGGLVTTTDAGMSVPDWPNTYGYNLFLYPWQTWLFGPWDLFVEHGHRLLASLVGLVTIALAVVLWRTDPRQSLRIAGLVAVAGVVGQGVLGGMRVLMDERTLAMIHGCVGPAFFAFVVTLCVVTSRRWRSPSADMPPRAASGMKQVAVVTVVVAYLQLMLGAVLRHMPAGSQPGLFRAAVFFHLIMAAALAVQVVLLRRQAGYTGDAGLATRRAANGLLALVAFQIALGSATWIAKYGWPPLVASYSWTAGYVIRAESLFQTHVVTAHVATGSLILALAVSLAVVSGGRVRTAASGRKLSASAAMELVA